MQWEGKIGPAFIVTCGLAAMTALGWYTDSRAAGVWTERVVRLETQMQNVIATSIRIEGKIDALKK